MDLCEIHIFVRYNLWQKFGIQISVQLQEWYAWTSWKISGMNYNLCFKLLTSKLRRKNKVLESFGCTFEPFFAQVDILE